jgi:hypothetical protein
MESISRASVAQWEKAVTSKNRRTLWRYLLIDAFRSCFRGGLALGYAIIVTAAIAIWQSLHHVSIERDGLWIFVRPYIIEFAVWFVYQISDSVSKFHKATLGGFAIKRLTELAGRGRFFFERACLPAEGAIEFANCWEHLAGRWTDETNKVILQYFGKVESDKFMRMSLTEADLQKPVPNVAGRSWSQYHQLQSSLENLNRLLERL